MLSIFLELRNSVQKSLIDLKMSAQITDADFQVVDELVSTLEPVALAVQALSQRDTNLISAEAAIQFNCIVQLQKRSFEIAKTMSDSLLSRMKHRCVVHSGILPYLHNGSDESSSDFNTAPPSSTIRKFTLSLLLRLDKARENGTLNDNCIRFVSIIYSLMM